MGPLRFSCIFEDTRLVTPKTVNGQRLLPKSCHLTPRNSVLVLVSPSTTIRLEIESFAEPTYIALDTYMYLFDLDDSIFEGLML